MKKQPLLLFFVYIICVSAIMKEGDVENILGIYEGTSCPNGPHDCDFVGNPCIVGSCVKTGIVN